MKLKFNDNSKILLNLLYFILYFRYVDYGINIIIHYASRAQRCIEKSPPDGY